MVKNQKNMMEKFLTDLVEELEISETLFEKAEARYKAIGEWIMRDNSQIRKYSPKIYLQGSFKLGTVIKPITEDDNYDIDSVCEYTLLNKTQISQNDLNTLMGEEVKGYAIANNMKEEPKDGKRCWTLKYHESAQFHMDILPAIPNKDSYELLLKKFNLDSIYKDTSIAISDKTSEAYDKISDDWEISNPEGYYKWFKNKIEEQFNQKRDFLAKSYNKKIEEIPDYKVKTSLQKAIQILKRHRDIFFKDNIENKPSSIIITTLSAMCYNGEAEIIDTLKNIIENLETKIEMVNGKSNILNPANPLENFADKWEGNHNLKNDFFNWTKKIKDDFQDFLNGRTDIFEDENNFLNSYGKIFGEKSIKNSYNKISKTGERIVEGAILTAAKPLKSWGDRY